MSTVDVNGIRAAVKERSRRLKLAHTENDITAWKPNQKTSRFLSLDRHGLTDLLAVGWVDVVRDPAPRHL